MRRIYQDPADEAEDGGAGKRWTFGVAAGALLVAGTVAAGTLGLGGDALPSGAEGAPEHAPSAPGNGPHGGGSPAAAGEQSDPDGDADRSAERKAIQPTKPASAGPRVTVPVQHAPRADAANTGGHATGESRSGSGESLSPAPAPAPEPAPAPGPVEQVVTPVTDTVSDVVTPVTDTVGDILSPITGVLGGGGGGDQPALTMIDPLGGLLGG